MSFIKGQFYKIIINVSSVDNPKLFTYSAKIIEVDTNFVTFKDKYNKEWNYALSAVFSYHLLTQEEIREDFLGENRNGN